MQSNLHKTFSLSLSTDALIYRLGRSVRWKFKMEIKRKQKRHRFKTQCVEIHAKLITAIQQSSKTWKASALENGLHVCKHACEMYLCESMTRQTNKQKHMMNINCWFKPSTLQRFHVEEINPFHTAPAYSARITINNTIGRMNYLLFAPCIRRFFYKFADALHTFRKPYIRWDIGMMHALNAWIWDLVWMSIKY